MNTVTPADPRRIGLTLVEVLTVLAIIGVLVAISVPALSRALARSQLTRCTSNQYQVAFALLRYDEQCGSIPGWLNDSPNVTGTACAWTVPLLPFLGRGDIYDTWPQLPNNPTVETFVCPSNRPGSDITYPVTHYAANAGAGGTDGDDGVFINVYNGAGTAVALDVIADADGTSTTLAFAEKAVLGFQPHTWAFKVKTAPVGSPFGSGTAAPPIFGAATPPGPVSPVVNTVTTRTFAPSSMHDGGVVVAFCDGHTAFLRDGLQPYEYAQLLTRRSRWQGTTNKTNSTAMQPWLLRNGQPYLLDEKVIKQ